MKNLPAVSFAERYNPFVSPQLEDPYPTYAVARREAPVFYSPVLSMWVVARYDDLASIYRNHEVFSSSIFLQSHTAPSAEVSRVLAEGGYTRKPLTVDNEPPDHTRVRAAVNKAFTPARVARLEPAIVALARELVSAFESDGRADLVARFSYSLPLLVILDLLGLPRADVHDIRKWSNAWSSFMWAPVTPERQLECARFMVEYMRYCKAHVAARKAALQDDLLSDLIRGQADEATALSDMEIVQMIYELPFAGQETTTNAIDNMVKLLLAHPEQWADLRQNPDLMPAAVDEALRADPPSHVGLRLTTREVEVAGVTLPAGVGVCMLIGSASHDEAFVPDGERFDIRRKKPEKPLSFGHGIHYCVAAMLGRTVMRVALEVLGERLRNVRLAPDKPISYEPNLMLRGPKQLELVWDPPATVG